MSKNNFGRLSCAAILSASVISGCGGRDAAGLDDFPAGPEPVIDNSEVYLEAESLTLSEGVEVQSDVELTYRGLESDPNRVHFGLNSFEFFEFQTRTSDVVTLDFTGEHIGFTIDNFVSEAIVISYLADFALPIDGRYATLGVEYFDGSVWAPAGNILLEPTEGRYKHAFVNLNDGDGFFFGTSFRIINNVGDVSSIDIDRVIISQNAQFIEDPQLFDLLTFAFVEEGNTLPEDVSLIGGATDFSAMDGISLETAGEGVQFRVPSTARGAARLVLNYANGNAGELELVVRNPQLVRDDMDEIILFEVDGDGEFVLDEEGEFVVTDDEDVGEPMEIFVDGVVQLEEEIVETSFAPDFLAIEDVMSGTVDTFFTPAVQEGQYLQIINRSGAADLSSTTLIGPPNFERFELEEGTVVSNGIPEFNNANTGVIGGQIANVTGNGDGVMFVSPFAATSVAFGYASQFATEHDLYVLSPEEAANFDPQAPRDVNAEFRTAIFEAPINSTDFVNANIPGASPEVLVVLDEPIQVGDVIYILFGTAAANYDYLSFFE